MSILKTKLTATLTCLCLLFSTALTTKIAAASETNSIYQNAKTQLPPDFYALYRIVDRIARANEYDTRPWQIVRVAKYDTQAFTKNTNFIPIYDGVLEQLGGDASALACMISHEMVHHKQRHQVVSNLEKVQLIAEIQQEAEKQVLSTDKTSPVTAVGDFVVRRVIGGAIGNVVGGVLDNQNNRRFRKAQKRINSIVETKTEELEENIDKQTRENEFEADKLAYLASVKAGFNKQGCLRAMSVLNRTPGVKFDENHPTIEERIAAIKPVMELNTENLVEEGEENLFKTQPLTYNFSANQTSLRVNSRHGASVGDDIDRMFGD